ncbi:MAG: hypothetical protein ACRDD7_06725 [Peptostreptococcaceae bacterium]
MDFDSLGFWELVKLNASLDIEFISRYWAWLLVFIIIYIILVVISDRL